jgi:hypothetical protein
MKSEGVNIEVKQRNEVGSTGGSRELKLQTSNIKKTPNFKPQEFKATKVLTQGAQSQGGTTKDTKNTK